MLIEKKQRFKKETSIQKCLNQNIPDTRKSIPLFVKIIK